VVGAPSVQIACVVADCDRDEADAKGDAVVISTSPLPGCNKALTLGSWYLASLTIAILMITGTGGTDFYPSHTSDSETVVVLVLVVCGALFWTHVLAIFCDIATNSNPALTLFNQSLDGLNDFIEYNKLPRALGRHLREYTHQMKGIRLQEYASTHLQSLSPVLQRDVVLHCHRSWIDASDGAAWWRQADGGAREAAGTAVVDGAASVGVQVRAEACQSRIGLKLV